MVARQTRTCARCVVFNKRPPHRGELMKLRVKDLQHFLTRKRINIKSCVGKEGTSCSTLETVVKVLQPDNAKLVLAESDNQQLSLPATIVCRPVSKQSSSSYTSFPQLPVSCYFCLEPGIRSFNTKGLLSPLPRLLPCQSNTCPVQSDNLQ